MHLFFEAGASAGVSTQSIGLVVVLLLAGLVFLGVELFILPGFGVAGIVGVLLIGGGSVAAWMLLGSTLGSIVIGATVVIGVVLSVVGFRSRAVRRRFVLETSLERGGGTASEDLSGLIGAFGETRSDLRPAGIALVDNRRVDVVSEGGFIEKGTQIKVTAVDGPRVVVARTD